ncbi:MAG: arylamine N-acetyltransferase [Streptosporangiaceae bacterium]
MLRGCRPVSGLSLIVSVIVIIAIWQRLCAYPEDAGGSPNRGGLSEPRRRHRIETRERSLADCVPTCWWQQTSLLSHFTRSTICSRLTPGGRVSISGRMLIQTQGGTRAEQQLDTDDVLLAAYREHFGIVLSGVPDDPAA